MPLNPDRAGAVYPAYTYEVSREKIREYALAVGETDPRYVSDDDMVAPPTFAACFTLMQAGANLMADPELGAHDALVHGSQSFSYGQRAIRPGDQLRCIPKIASITSRGDNDFLTLEIDCRFTDTGEQAVLASETIVFLGAAPAAPKAADTAALRANPATVGDPDANRGARQAGAV